MLIECVFEWNYQFIYLLCFSLIGQTCTEEMMRCPVMFSDQIRIALTSVTETLGCFIGWRPWGLVASISARRPQAHLKQLFSCLFICYPRGLDGISSCKLCSWSQEELLCFIRVLFPPFSFFLFLFFIINSVHLVLVARAWIWGYLCDYRQPIAATLLERQMTPIPQQALTANNSSSVVSLDIFDPWFVESIDIEPVDPQQSGQCQS